MAYRIALSYNNIECSIPISDKEMKEICALLINSTEKNQKSPKNPSYGDIVAAVDFVLKPEELFVKRGKNISFPNSLDDINPRFFDKRLNIRSVVDLLRGVTNNESHFQEGVHFYAYTWHEKAANHAKEKRIVSAVLARAIASHYLHDYFAPGHVLGARDGVYDAVSLYFHDKYNWTGTGYEIKDWGRYTKIAEFIKLNHNKLGIAQDLLSGLEALELDREVEFSDGTPMQLNIFGDGYLKYNPQQEMLIVLEEVALLNEIFVCAYRNTCSNSNSKTYSWNPVDNITSTGEVRILSETHIGSYKIEPIPKAIFANHGELSLGQETVFQSGNQVSDINSGSRATISGSLSFTPIKTESLYQEIDRGDFVRNLWFGPAFKYRYSNSYQTFGIGGKVTYAFPRIDTKLSLTLLGTHTNVKEHQNTVRLVINDTIFYGVETVKDSDFQGAEASVRVDLGFSLLSGFIEFGYGNAMYTSVVGPTVGSVEGDYFIGLGTSISFPVAGYKLQRNKRLDHFQE